MPSPTHSRVQSPSRANAGFGSGAKEIPRGVQHLFDAAIESFLSHADEPRWNESVMLFDSLARLASIVDPESEPTFRDLLLQFMWEEASLSATQSNLATLLSHAPPKLRDHFAPFLSLPLRNANQQAAAHAYLCTLTGLPNRVPARSARRSLRTSQMTKPPRLPTSSMTRDDVMTEAPAGGAVRGKELSSSTSARTGRGGAAGT